MRKIFSSVLVMVFGLFFVSSINLKADTPIVEATDGASIRAAEGEVKQGLRFYAKLNDEADEHGFYLVFGEATVGELQTALDEQGEAEFASLNGKNVFRVEVPGVTQDNEFSVVLTGIPELGYLQKVSVFPFAVVDEEEIIVNSVTRSVAEVALKAANSGEVNQDVIDDLEGNFKRLDMNAFGELELTGNMLETNHFKLREEFIKDWNTKFGTAWTELVGSTFDAYAQVGQQTGDLSGTRSYQFFNDPLYKDKWEFVLNIMVIKGSGTTWPMVQAQALLGDGTVEGRPNLNVGRHLHFSIANFFNGNYEVYGYSGVNFSNKQIYIDVLDMIKGVYVNLSDYEFYKPGGEFEFEAAPVKKGYNFAHYKVGQQTYLAGSQYEVTASDALFELVYNPIQYNITYYDEEVKIDELDNTYTIEDDVTLPDYNKDGFVFEGWYDNPELEGNPIASIVKGSTGNKVFYAQMTASQGSSDIIYNLDGGGFYKYASRAEMITDFMADYHRLTGRTQGPEEFNVSTDPIVNGFLLETEIATKWGWLLDYMIGLSQAADHPGTANLIARTGNIWRWTIHAFLNKTGALTVSTVDYRISANADGYWDSSKKEAPETYEHGHEVELLIPIKVGFTFGGWYLEADFSGTAITKISEESTGDVVLYAKWE